ncbi:MAG: peptidylprolyl isomerase [Acidobacteriaceae bacterium]|nr:peptidylprolyl isomerase [Acidobacteriaceae bacterium]
MRYRFFAAFLLCCWAGSFLHLTGQVSKSQAHRAAKPTTPAEPALPPVALPEQPGLYAVIYTSMGNIVCRLFEKEAPKTVANFRGLATGTKVWTDPITGKPKHTPLYSRTSFHRVIPDFMIQGGDPAGDGTGAPGYKIDDEISPDLKFDHPGVLAMANSGPNTNGSQFFITVAPAEHLEGHYSIFGEVVSGQEVADAISKVPRDDNDKPKEPIKIKAIAIRTVPSTTAGSGR